MKAISIDVASHSLAPLYRRLNDTSPPQPAFLQLNPENGHVSFGVRPDHLITAAEEKGQLLRWPILPEIRDSHCLAVAEALRPLLQTVQNGYYEQLDDLMNRNYCSSDFSTKRPRGRASGSAPCWPTSSTPAIQIMFARYAIRKISSEIGSHSMERSNRRLPTNSWTNLHATIFMPQPTREFLSTAR